LRRADQSILVREEARSLKTLPTTGTSEEGKVRVVLIGLQSAEAHLASREIKFSKGALSAERAVNP
jgi:hypothetical protein